MKKIIIAAILGLTLISELRSQTTTITLPTFKDDVVIMKVNLYITVDDSYFVISDGGEVTFMSALAKEHEIKKNEQGASNVPALANILNQLKKQGYRLIELNSVYTGEPGRIIERYVFQKN